MIVTLIGLAVLMLAGAASAGGTANRAIRRQLDTTVGDFGSPLVVRQDRELHALTSTRPGRARRR